jgi:hypothetical protein
VHLDASAPLQAQHDAGVCFAWTDLHDLRLSSGEPSRSRGSSMRPGLECARKEEPEASESARNRGMRIAVVIQTEIDDRPFERLAVRVEDRCRRRSLRGRARMRNGST